MAQNKIAENLLKISKKVAKTSHGEEVSIAVIKQFLNAMDYVESLLRICVHRLSLKVNLKTSKVVADPNYKKFLI